MIMLLRASIYLLNIGPMISQEDITNPSLILIDVYVRRCEVATRLHG